MKLSWLKPNIKGLVILVGVLIILTALFFLFGKTTPIKTSHHASDGAIYSTYSKQQINWKYLCFAVITLVFSYPISMYIARSTSSKPGPTICSIITQVIFILLASAGLVCMTLFDRLLSLPGTFFFALTILLTIPLFVLLLARLRKSHPAISTTVGIVLGVLLCTGSFWIYYTRPAALFSYFAAACLSIPLFVLASLGFKKTTIILYSSSLLIVAAVYYIPWNVRSCFLRDLDRINPRMSYAEVERIMEKYPHRKWFTPLDEFSVQCLIPENNKSVPLSAGLSHLVVIKRDGSLAAWGSNKSGECNVPSGNDFVAVGAGCSYSVVFCHN